MPAWAAWLGGVLFALAPFSRDWSFVHGKVLLAARMGQGNPMVEWMVWPVASLIGGAAACWWRERISLRSEKAAIIGALGLLVLGVVGMAGVPSPIVLLIDLCLVVSLLRWPAGDGQKPTETDSWLRQRTDFNAVYFWIFILINTACDAVISGSLPGGVGEAIWFVSGRFFTYVTLTAAMWFVIRFHGRWAPRGANVIGWIAMILIPVAGILDSTMRLLWSKGMTAFCQELQISGWADFRRVIKGGEVSVTGGQVAMLIGLIFCLSLTFVIAGRLSRHPRWQLSPRGHLVMAIAGWLMLTAQQALGLWWVPREARIWEYRTCLLQLSPLDVPNGCATFDVAWRLDPAGNGRTDGNKPTVEFSGMNVPPAVRPDIYLIIVETLRADGLRPDVTPFLSRWQAEECQRIGVTYSASNATHLSWFSIFHGLPASLWTDHRGRPQTAPFLIAAHDAGYQVEVRGAGTYDYMDMLAGNFGDAGKFRILEHANSANGHEHEEVPEREVRMIDSIRKSVKATPQGTAFHVVTLDAPHYPYKWGQDWKPPIADYDPNPVFPINPSSLDITRIKARYHNSLSWLDSRIAVFVSNLRQQGRYDNALIIITGDHGEEFQEHGFWFHASALSLEQTTVPLLVKWPVSRGRGPDRAQASHFDIAPTLLEVIGIPEKEWSHLPGRSLSQSGSGTAMVATRCASRDSEAMHWRREGWQAAFSWPRAWLAETPHQIWLERLDGPSGRVLLDSPAAYEAALRTRFPDVFPRFFNHFELVKEP